MDDLQQPVRKRSETAVKNSNASANDIQRIAASPRQIKTQIAKISYTSMKTSQKETKKNSSRCQQLEYNSTEPELSTTNVTNCTRTEFEKEKEKREKEFTDLKMHLNEIANKKVDSCNEKDADEDPETLSIKDSKNKSPTFRRCKTEILGTEPGPQTERNFKTRIGAKARSKSSQPPETKSPELLPPDSSKRKSYNVEEARKFLDEQKRRRRSQKAASSIKFNNEKTAFEKEQIKRRLEELRKNSRAIIAKNVNRKKLPLGNKNIIKSNQKSTTDPRKSNENEADHILIQSTVKMANECKESSKNVACVDDKSTELPKDKTENLDAEDERKVENIDSAMDSRANEESKAISPHTSYLNNKRIGLLRKQETKDHSFSAIREFSFDKENIALEMMTPKLRQTVSLKSKTLSNDIATKLKRVEEKPVENTYRKPAPNKNILECAQSVDLRNIENSKFSGADPVQICDDDKISNLSDKTQTIPQNDLPYWLKPSSVHIYPYNFIMAVRRKLEALADVNQQSTIQNESAKELSIIKSESDVTLVSEANKKSIQESAKQSLNSKGKKALAECDITYISEIDNKSNQKSLKQSCNSESKTPVPEKSLVDHTIAVDKIVNQKLITPRNSSVQSELNSNLSSMSIQLMASSNTISEAITKKTKSIPLTYAKPKAAMPSEDDTTISSSIFNSPERNIRLINVSNDADKFGETQRVISPLSLERVENLTITSNKRIKRAIAARYVNTSRGDIFQPCQTDPSLTHKGNIGHEIDFNQLLDDFNRSLSQVIEVNDRLKSTVNKSNEICGSEQSREPLEPSSLKSDEYTEDFEKNSSQRSQDIFSELSENCNKASFERTNKNYKSESIKSSETGSIVHGLKEVDECSNTLLNPIRHAYINSSFSSLNSNGPSEVSKNRMEVSPHELDKHLQNIEKVKEKFKQTILSSQKMRHSQNCQQKSATNMENKSLKITDSLDEQKDEDIQTELRTEMGRKTDSSKSQRKTLLKNETERCDNNFSSKYVTASHKLIEILDYSSLELSLDSANNDSLSDSPCNYSNVGLYEKLIRNETTKSEHLTALLKMRKKALFDRTKGQIAWLEVQKERCKSKGLLLQISAIKKKQRGILLKMEKEREEIKRLLQSTTTTTSTESSANRATGEYVPTPKEFDKSAVSQKTSPKIAHKITQLSRNEKQPNTLVTFPQPASVNTISKYARSISQPKVNAETTRSVPVVRANYALESSRSLEELLRKRESDLRRRREHVERLMQWHRRLDREEAEVLQMENALITFTKPIFSDEVKKRHQNHAGMVPIKNIGTYAKTHRRLKEIENSLRELNGISSTLTTEESNEGSGEENKSNSFEFVRTTGNKLNKLWRRLTSQQVEKYEPNKHYELSKRDLECLYEAAKIAVLQDFVQNKGHLAADLLEKSVSKNISQKSFQQQEKHESDLVPSLKLYTSSEPSDKEEESWEEASPNSLLLGTYRPSITAENVQYFERDSGSTLLMTKHNSELSLFPKMRNLSSCTTRDVGLMRSLSDTVLYNKCRSSHDSKNKPFNIYKDQFAENFRRSMSNADRLPPYKAETNVKLPLFLITAQQKPSEQESDGLTPDAQHCTTATNQQIERTSVINFPNSSGESTTERKTATEIGENFVDANLCEELSNHTSPSEASFHTLNDKLKRASDDQEIQNSLQLISSCVPSSYSFEVNSNDDSQQSFAILTASNQEKSENDSSCFSKNINDSNENQSIDEQESFNSKTFVSQSKLSQYTDTAERETINTYEEDFESTSELTQIDDLSLPHFESIVDTSLGGNSGNEEKYENQIQKNYESKNIYQDVPMCSEVLGKHETSPPLLSNLDISPSAPPPPAPSATESTRLQSTAQNINNENTSLTVNSVQLMPDIINELEIRRCQQILIENEQMKQFDNSSSVMPYMYVREIPNKPPPPYVPPAHGSPMTTIFPSEERIKEISYRRTHELYCELLKTDYINEAGEKLPSVMDEKITNIYERIILDICREYLDEHIEVLRQGDPINFYTQLAFFNPPNRLRCMQEFVYKEVRRCLAMDKIAKRRTPIYSVYGQRAKRDHIGKIIIQEMYDEDNKWCNFQREENEVVEFIIYEMVEKLLTDVAKEVLIEEGGTIEISNGDNEDENINSFSPDAELTQLNST